MAESRKKDLSIGFHPSTYSTWSWDSNPVLGGTKACILLTTSAPPRTHQPFTIHSPSTHLPIFYALIPTFIYLLTHLPIHLSHPCTHPPTHTPTSICPLICPIPKPICPLLIHLPIYHSPIHLPYTHPPIYLIHASSTHLSIHPSILPLSPYSSHYPPICLSIHPFHLFTIYRSVDLPTYLHFPIHLPHLSSIHLLLIHPSIQPAILHYPPILSMSFHLLPTHPPIHSPTVEGAAWSRTRHIQTVNIHCDKVSAGRKQHGTRPRLRSRLFLSLGPQLISYVTLGVWIQTQGYRSPRPLLFLLTPVPFNPNLGGRDEHGKIIPCSKGIKRLMLLK